MASPALRILVAEDESVTALGLEQDLKALGHTVIGIAGDGVTAVSMARTLSPDLILMDVRMPHLDGLEAAAQIHSERPVPIVLVTAYSDADTIARTREIPVFHYLVKPVSSGQLSAAIAVARVRHDEWLRERRSTEELRRKLDERKLIERAKGILMEREGLTEAAAYKVLQRTSQSRNMSMAELSRSLLAAEDLMRQPSVREPTREQSRPESSQRR